MANSADRTHQQASRRPTLRDYIDAANAAADDLRVIDTYDKPDPDDVSPWGDRGEIIALAADAGAVLSVVLGEDMLADSIGPLLTCSEVDRIVVALHTLDQSGAAITLLGAHARGDREDEGDDHYHLYDPDLDSGYDQDEIADYTAHLANRAEPGSGAEHT